MEKKTPTAQAHAAENANINEYLKQFMTVPPEEPFPYIRDEDERQETRISFSTDDDSLEERPRPRRPRIVIEKRTSFAAGVVKSERKSEAASDDDGKSPKGSKTLLKKKRKSAVLQASEKCTKGSKERGGTSSSDKSSDEQMSPTSRRFSNESSIKEEVKARRKSSRPAEPRSTAAPSLRRTTEIFKTRESLARKNSSTVSGPSTASGKKSPRQSFAGGTSNTRRYSRS